MKQSNSQHLHMYINLTSHISHKQGSCEWGQTYQEVIIIFELRVVTKTKLKTQSCTKTKCTLTQTYLLVISLGMSQFKKFKLI
jgi:hypothetical protein